MRKLILIAILTMLASPVRAATYYVGTTGNDSNAGTTSASPWKTIQHAANVMAPGDVTEVLAGKYAERVYVSRAGSASQPIVFEAQPNAIVQMQGFEILNGANYIQVIGFEITGASHIAGDIEHSFGILWEGANGLIQDNNIHDLCAEGIMMGWTGNDSDPTVAHNEILNNRITHAEMAGIEVDGQNNSVLGNDIDTTLQFPIGCPARPSADADGMRAFGSGHLIEKNVIHGMLLGTTATPSAHTDCLQTWGPLSNTTFEGNLCYFPAIAGTATSASGNSAATIDNSSGLVQHVWIFNNVFSTMRQGANVMADGPTALSDFEFVNNTLVNIAQEGVLTESLTGAIIENNIFYNVGTGLGGGDSYFCDNGKSTYTLSANDFWVTSGSPGTWPQNYPHLQVNPGFIDPQSNQYQLSATSPLIGQGQTVTNVTIDAQGSPRPAGAYDVGAFQH